MRWWPVCNHRTMRHAARAPRLVFLSGACGSGKTAVLELGYHALKAAFAGDTAAIDTDRVWMFIDPRWEFRHPDNERHAALTRQQWALLARSFFEFGFAAVIIGGNAVWHLESVAEVADSLRDVAEIYHVTLDPSWEVICDRVERRGDGNKSREWLRTHVDWMRGHYAEGWTHVVDNSTMTPEETLAAVVAAVESGEAVLPPESPERRRREAYGDSSAG